MKNILLIGGSYGIGRSLVANLQGKAHLFVASRSAEDLAGLDVTHLPFDALSDTLDMVQLPSVLHGFVYCPGSITLRAFRSLKPDAFRQDMDLNFFSMVKTLQQILPQLGAADQASVVLFSSVAASKGMPFHTSVAACKAAIEGFARAFAAEHAPKIRANVIAPSLTDTPLAAKLLNGQARQEQAAARHPMQRYGTPDDLAQMAAFLLGDESSWITGQVFPVDGGLSNLIINA